MVEKPARLSPLDSRLAKAQRVVNDIETRASKLVQSTLKARDKLPWQPEVELINIVSPCAMDSRWCALFQTDCFIMRQRQETISISFYFRVLFFPSFSFFFYLSVTKMETIIKWFVTKICNKDLINSNKENVFSL